MEIRAWQKESIVALKLPEEMGKSTELIHHHHTPGLCLSTPENQVQTWKNPQKQKSKRHDYRWGKVNLKHHCHPCYLRVITKTHLLKFHIPDPTFWWRRFWVREYQQAREHIQNSREYRCKTNLNYTMGNMCCLPCFGREGFYLWAGSGGLTHFEHFLAGGYNLGICLRGVEKLGFLFL